MSGEFVDSLSKSNNDFYSCFGDDSPFIKVGKGSLKVAQREEVSNSKVKKLSDYPVDFAQGGARVEAKTVSDLALVSEPLEEFYSLSGEDSSFVELVKPFVVIDPAATKPEHADAKFMGGNLPAVGGNRFGEYLEEDPPAVGGNPFGEYLEGDPPAVGNPFGEYLEDDTFADVGSDLSSWVYVENGANEQSPSIDRLDVLDAYIGMLNAYIHENPAHLKEILSDLKDPAIAAILTTSTKAGEGVRIGKWLELKMAPPSQEQMNAMYKAFSHRHGAGSAFDRHLGQLDFVGLKQPVFGSLSEVRGQAIYKTQGWFEAIVEGRSAVEMKSKILDEVLQHLALSPATKAQAPLPMKVVEALINYYGHLDKQKQAAAGDAQKVAAGLVPELGGGTFWTKLKGLVHWSKTAAEVHEAIKVFDGKVSDLGKGVVEGLQGALLTRELNHGSAAVAERTLNRINAALVRAHGDYSALHPAGTNYFPEKLSEGSVEQIQTRAESLDESAKADLVKIYAEAYMAALQKGIASPPYDALNAYAPVENLLPTLVEVRASQASVLTAADAQLKLLTGMLGESSEEVLAGFDEQRRQLRETLLTNLQGGLTGALEKWDADLRAVIKASGSGQPSLVGRVFSTVGALATGALAKLGIGSPAVSSAAVPDQYVLNRAMLPKVSALIEGVEKLCTQIHQDGLDPGAAKLQIEQCTQPIMAEIMPQLATPGRWETFKQGVGMAFQPTIKRTLVAMPLFAWVASANRLPKWLEKPISNVLTVLAPVILLGWIGYNVKQSFTQRREFTNSIEQINNAWQRMQAAVDSLSTPRTI